MVTVRCYFEDGNIIISDINTTFEGAREYYLNKTFNIGSAEDNMQKCIKIEEVKETMENIKILLNVVCKINYKDNCGNCPLRINGKCASLTKDNKYNIELEQVAKNFIKGKSVYVYQSKEDSTAYYVTNGRINSKGNYLFARLEMKDQYNLLVNELTLINKFKEIKL